MAAPRIAPYQRAVFTELRECALDFFGIDWTSLPIRPRANHLLAGSTGTGKTFLVAELARGLGLPCLRLFFSNWILLGCTRRGAEATLPLLYRFVAEHEAGIVHLDEVDKLGDKTEWTQAVVLEMFSVLDREVLTGVLDREDQPAADEEQGDEPLGVAPPPPRSDAGTIEGRRREREARFRAGFFCVGSGAWQHLWGTGARGAAGRGAGGWEHVIDDLGRSAGPGSSPPGRLAYGRLVESLPQELVNRFGQGLLFLPPLARTDYVELLEASVAALPGELREAARREGLATLDRAVETAQGYRWIEEVLALALRHCRRAGALTRSIAPRPPKPLTPATAAGETRISPY